MYLHIIQRIELTSEEVIQQDCRVVWGLWVNEYHIRRKLSSSYIDQQDLTLVIRGTIGDLDSVVQGNLPDSNKSVSFSDPFYNTHWCYSDIASSSSLLKTNL